MPLPQRQKGKQVNRKKLLLYKDIKIDNRWAKLSILFQIGLSLLVISGLFTFLHERIRLAFTADGLSQFPTLHLSVLLLFVIMFLVTQWIRDSSGEDNALLR